MTREERIEALIARWDGLSDFERSQVIGWLMSAAPGQVAAAIDGVISCRNPAGQPKSGTAVRKTV